MSSITSLNDILLNIGETLNVSMDFTLAIPTDVTISSADPTCESSDVIITNANVSGTSVYFTIASDTVGNYKIEVTVNLSNSEILIGEGHLKVRNS